MTQLAAHSTDNGYYVAFDVHFWPKNVDLSRRDPERLRFCPDPTPLMRALRDICLAAPIIAS